MMLSTKLHNKFLELKTTETRSAYNKQTNICVSILRKAKRSYFENLDIKNLSDNRKFWGTVKPLFSNKVRSNDNITLNKNDLLIRNEYKIANIFNTFFVNIVPNLGIEIDQQYLSNASNILIQLKVLLRNTKNILVFLLLIKWFQVSKMKQVSLSHVLL